MRTKHTACWSSGVLGSENPTSLNYTIFVIFSQHFGTRGRQEHHQIRIEDVKIVRAATTRQISHVEWTEGPTKKRQGGFKKHPRQVTQKLIRTGENCRPITYFEKLLSKRPPALSCSVTSMEASDYLVPSTVHVHSIHQYNYNHFCDATVYVYKSAV